MSWELFYFMLFSKFEHFFVIIPTFTYSTIICFNMYSYIYSFISHQQSVACLYTISYLVKEALFQVIRFNGGSPDVRLPL